MLHRMEAGKSHRSRIEDVSQSRLFMRMGGKGDSAWFNRNGGIAQLVEHELCKLGATGSNPVASTFFGRVAQLVRARP